VNLSRWRLQTSELDCRVCDTVTRIATRRPRTPVLYRVSGIYLNVNNISTYFQAAPDVGPCSTRICGRGTGPDHLYFLYLLTLCCFTENHNVRAPKFMGTFRPNSIISPAGVVAKYCNEHVCVCVCVSVCPRRYLPNHTRDLLPNYFSMLPMTVARSSSGGMTKFQGKGGIGGGSSPLTVRCTA